MELKNVSDIQNIGKSQNGIMENKSILGGNNN